MGIDADGDFFYIEFINGEIITAISYYRSSTKIQFLELELDYDTVMEEVYVLEQL